jgi:glutamate synthase (NADPH/NADH) large chain
VVVLGPTGRNFAAGMSGGIAYVYDCRGSFPSLVNYEMVDLEPLEMDERLWLLDLVERHRDLTGSRVAARLLQDWSDQVGRFHKVMPKDYRRVLRVMREAEENGLSESETLARVMEAAHG